MIPFVLFTNTINTYVKTKIGDIVTAELGTFIKLWMNIIKICLWECTQQQLCCYTLKWKRCRCDKTTITGCTGSYHFDNLQCRQWRKSKKLSLLCMSNMETRSRRITSCQCSLLRLLLRPPGPQSMIKGLPQHPRHRITDFLLSVVVTNIAIDFITVITI